MSIFGAIRNSLLAALAVPALAGCSLIMSGMSQDVTFASEPPGATFTVAGETHTTPVTLTVPKEDYLLVFSKPGYRESTFELKRQMSNWFYASLVAGVMASAVDVVTGSWKIFQTTDVQVTLEPDPESSEEIPVRIVSDPPGAEILVAGTLHGVTPGNLKLVWKKSELEKKVTLRLARYREVTVPLRPPMATLRTTLEPEPMTVKVYVTSRPAGAEVRIGDRAAGRTPVTAEVVWLPNDAPKPVRVVRDGYHPATLELKSESQKELAVDLSEVVVEEPLPLKLAPPGIDVEVDGAAQAPGVSELRLRWSESIRRHSLKFSAPGYVSKTLEVTRESGKAPLEVRLVPLLPRVP